MGARLRCSLAASPCVLALAVASSIAGCSSWNTGSDDGDGPEKACLATVDAFARAAERCGQDYATTHDALLMQFANGDCKNVRSIRDENALRTTCLPFAMSAPCSDIRSGMSDPSCSQQLLRTASVRPRLR